MFNVAKYIRTSEDNIVIFPCTMVHSMFKSLNPVSAGFIKIHNKPDDSGIIDVSCECYGESVSLNLKSCIDDSRLAYLELIHTKSQ